MGLVRFCGGLVRGWRVDGEVSRVGRRSTRVGAAFRGAGGRGCERSAWLRKPLGAAEVDQLQVAVAVQEKVFWLEVPVDDLQRNCSCVTEWSGLVADLCTNILISQAR